MHGAQATITAAILSWPNVSVAPDRFGGVAYLFGGRREIGHIHSDRLVNIPFPREAAAVETAIGLLWRYFELAANQKRKGRSRPE